MICLLLCALFACGTNAEPQRQDRAGTDDADRPSAEAIDSCKDACDQQQFFDCYEPDDLAWCYDRCETVDATAVELYTACVTNTSCDRGCDVHIEDGGTIPDPDPATGCEAQCVDFADACQPELADVCDFVCAQAEEVVTECLDDAVGCYVTEACEDQLEALF